MRNERDFLMVKRSGSNVVLNFHDGKLELDSKAATNLVSSLRQDSRSVDSGFKLQQLELKRFNSYVELTFFIPEEDALVAKTYKLDVTQAEYLAAGIQRAIPVH